MPRAHASEAQIAAALREIEAGTPATEVARRLGVHLNTLLHWEKHYGGLGVPEVRELRLPARRESQAQAASRGSEPGAQDPPGRALKKALKPVRQRELVGYVKAHDPVGQRRSCWILRFNRSTGYYRPKLETKNAALLAQLKLIAETRIHYGYRRITDRLRIQGLRVNHKRVQRLYRLSAWVCIVIGHVGAGPL